MPCRLATFAPMNTALNENKIIPTAVYAEITPNPSVVKFVADRPLISGGLQVEYLSQKETQGSSPLAQELFNFPFVVSVFISGNYVSVTKDETLGWEMIVMQLREYIKEWLMENEVAVTSVPDVLINRQPNTDSPSRSTTSSAKVDYAAMVPTEFDDDIRMLLDEFVRPAVEQDGGAIDFKAFSEGKVYVQLRGACSGCPSSMLTLKSGIETLLKANLPVVEEVVAEEV
jgi:NFU1 iron-sulfur cluster scaffold homolog, mitochondrial